MTVVSVVGNTVMDVQNGPITITMNTTETRTVVKLDDPVPPIPSSTNTF